MLVPHNVALGMEEGLEALVPLGVALVELEVEVDLDELVEVLVLLDVAHAVGSFSLVRVEGVPIFR